MDELTRHIDEITTHLIGVAIWERLHLNEILTVGAIWIWLKKARSSSWWSRINKPVKVILYVLMSLLMIGRAWSAFRTYHRSGFVNGAWFAIDCFVLLALALILIYTVIRRVSPSGIKRLNWAQDVKLWKTHSAPIGKPGIAPHSNKSLRFRVHFTGEGDRWANLEVQFPNAQDFRGWVGIRFDIRSDHVYPESTICLQVGTSSDSHYLSEKRVPINDQTVLFLFQEMWWADWTTKSPVGYLDLQQVVKVAVVCHSAFDDVEFTVSEFALVKFADPSI